MDIKWDTVLVTICTAVVLLLIYTIARRDDGDAFREVMAEVVAFEH
jgi:hypothetical protein